MRTHFIVITVSLLAFTRIASAYDLIEFTNLNGERVHLHWNADDQPAPWFFSSAEPPNNFSLDAAIDTTQASYDAWEAVETSSITFHFSGKTNAEPFVFFDFINTVGFISDPSLRGTGILAATDFIVFTITGEIAESDIFFNNDIPWSVAPNGRLGQFDFQSTATHEIGHFLGLGHSGVGVMESRRGRRTLEEGSALMFPFAFPPGTTTGRTLTLDDITGASVIYPAGDFTSSTARMSGTVTKNGEGVEGAHVTAYNPFTDELIGIFTDGGGNYRIGGLSAGPIVVRVNPITDPTSPADFGRNDFLIDLEYEVTFHEGRAEVTPGTNTPGIDVAVTP